MRGRSPLAALAVMLAANPLGCEPEAPPGAPSEKVLSASEMAAGPNKPVAGLTGPGGDSAPGSLEPGVPEEPAPGIPDQPSAPGNAPSATAGAPNAAGPGNPPGAPPMAGPAVVIRGEVLYDDYTGGPIQIDVMDGPSTGPSGTQPKVIQLERLARPGPFTIRLPKNAGPVYLAAFNDADENGRPDREDPHGVYDANPLQVGDDDLTGVKLALTIEEMPPPPQGF